MSAPARRVEEARTGPMRLVPPAESGPAGGGDRGSASLWVVSCMALLLVVSSVATIRTAAVVARHRAESAADLAALAGAARIGVDATACAAARGIASANGARLRGCHTVLAADGRSGTVTVRLALRVSLPIAGGSTVIATARAGRLPASAGGPSPLSEASRSVRTR